VPERSLIAEAEKVVEAVRRKLPADVRALAEQIPVVYYDFPSEEILGEEFEPDILGMFVGTPHCADDAATGAVPTHIMLFVENIADEAEGDPARFREEVRLTYLHELGHCLGWDEDDLERRGLA
jgi:predicted Zn-dependent protease with MMP-like domain